MTTFIFTKQQKISGMNLGTDRRANDVQELVMRNGWVRVHGDSLFLLRLKCVVYDDTKLILDKLSGGPTFLGQCFCVGNI